MAGQTGELMTPVRERDVTPQIAQNSDDPAVIRAQIEQTRAQMGRTIDEIQERLSPDRIKQETQDAIREATLGKVEQMANTAERKMNNWRTNMMETVKSNPVPAALVGIGLGWLLLSDSGKSAQMNDRYNGRQYGGSRGYDTPSGRQRTYTTDAYGRRYYYYDTEENQGRTEQAREWAGEQVGRAQAMASDTMDDVRQRAEETTEHLRDRAMETRDQVEERAMALQEQAQQQIYQVRRTFWETLDSNPLAVGAAALAVGAVVGLALPGTAKEDELMGETRDHLVEEAKATAQETMRKVQTVAERTQQTAKEEARRAAEDEGLTMNQTNEGNQGSQSKPKSNANPTPGTTAASRTETSSGRSYPGS